VGVIDAVDDASRAYRLRYAVVKTGLRANNHFLHRAAATPQVPDLHAAIATGCGKDAAGAAAWLETHLLKGRCVVAQNGDGRLRHHINHSTRLVTRGGGQKVVVLRELKVNDGITVDRE
jgi:hypothetical protein